MERMHTGYSPRAEKGATMWREIDHFQPKTVQTTGHRLILCINNELTHLFVTVSGDTVPFPSLSIFPNASRTNPSLSPLNRGLVASSSACHGATPLASPPPPPARRAPPSASRWVNKARTSAVVNPALDEDNAALKSPKERNPSLFLVGGKVKRLVGPPRNIFRLQEQSCAFRQSVVRLFRGRKLSVAQHVNLGESHVFENGLCGIDCKYGPRLGTPTQYERRLPIGFFASELAKYVEKHNFNNNGAGKCKARTGPRQTTPFLTPRVPTPRRGPAPRRPASKGWQPRRR